MDKTLINIEEMKLSNNDIFLFVKKFSLVYSGLLPISILTTEELNDLSIFKELNGKEHFNNVVLDISKNLY